MNANMKRRLVLAVALVVSALVARARADGSKEAAFLAFPVKTDLERELLGSRADAYLQFDMESCAHDRKFDETRIDRDGLKKTLAELAKKIGKPKPRLSIGYRYSNTYGESGEREAVEKAIRAVCREAGFGDGRWSMLGEGGSWQEKIAPFSGPDGDAEAGESALQNDFVRAFPVRTKLSRFTLGAADCDCYLIVKQPIEKNFKDFSLETRLAISELIEKLNLEQRRSVVVYCMTTTAGQETAQRYFQPGGDKWESRADRFAKKLGFRMCRNVTCPMRVSPEELLGKPAPDFTLDALNGGKIRLREMIRGRVALIAFWGVACGACCEEAPHLSALYDRYKDKGLVVVGVNGYDETKPKVDRFARAKHLTHPIALMGGKVAEQYTVGSYPVTWLVDHNGTIIDYRLGFDEGDERLLANSVGRLLAERERAGGGK